MSIEPEPVEPAEVAVPKGKRRSMSIRVRLALTYSTRSLVRSGIITSDCRS